MMMSDMDGTLRSVIGMADCPYQKIYGDRLDKLEKQQNENCNRISKAEKNQAVMMERITNSLDHLSRLPEAIDSLKTTNIKLENKIDNVESKVNGLKNDFHGIKNKVNTIDEDGKINIRLGFKDWIIKNWISIALSIFLVGVFIKELSKTVI